MSIRSALADLIKPAAPVEDAATDPRNQLKQGIFSNVKIIVLVAFVALLAYNATNKIFTSENMKDISEVVKLLIIIEGVVHLAIVLGNTWIKALEVKAFMADGTLTETERGALSDKTSSGTVTATATVTTPVSTPAATPVSTPTATL